MSQQGIFSIAPDAEPNQQNGNSSGAASPFTAVSSNGAQAAPEQNSPFAAASQSPFQQVHTNLEDETQQAGIPQPRPEGQPPAIKGVAPSDEGNPEAAQAQGQHVFEAAPQSAQSNGGPFQMNGFPEQAAGQFTEAAPIAQSQRDSPFAVAQNDRHNYEAAKAELEPQQDFAAVQPRYTPEPAPAPAPQQPQPTLTPVASAAMATVTPQAQQQVPQAMTPQPAPAFQQLELRAIFGVDHPLDQQEIIQRARTLPGVRNVAVVGEHESAALSNFRQAMQTMGFGDSREMKLNAAGGDVDFLSEGETTIAVLHEGTYAPGVQETLIIVAREIGKLA
ncbi:MAG: hypothetical protein AB8F34_11580 [Akkermansiaceae bacterium]